MSDTITPLVAPALSSVPVWRRPSMDLAAELRDAEIMVRRSRARQDALRAELVSRGVLSDFGYGDAVALERNLCLVSIHEARRRVARSTALYGTRDGAAVVAAVAPLVAAAAEEGALGVEQIEEIIGTLCALPTVVTMQEREGYEKTLVDLARESSPAQVRKACRHLLAVVSQDVDSDNVEAELAAPARELRIHRRRDGRVSLTGVLDQETGVLLETVLSPLTKPRPAEDGIPDPRLAKQRNADAFAEILALVQRAGELPIEGGQKPTIMVALDYDTLRTQLTTAGFASSASAGGAGLSAAGGQRAAATLADGTPITPSLARRLACDADIIPVVLGGSSEILDLGRTQRLVTPAQRRALVLRDKGCIRCGRPPQWCQAHHIQHWIDGGPTNLDNLCLLCTQCHRLIHHSQWTITTHNHTPECVPPPWLHPQQSRNPILTC